MVEEMYNEPTVVARVDAVMSDEVKSQAGKCPEPPVDQFDQKF